ncbi:prepilin peptidase [Parasphingorhabdus sp. DH2-15]|uniref:prepilin peptidase n=1 Tax=Parasphingorhabdus sp. DH2-15 TaxID=3444112 RepID=UPI003F687978
MLSQFLFHPLYAPILAGLFGAILGSFIAALVGRWPVGRSVAEGRSRCDACAATLRWYELVPIVSYVVQQGRCRRCGDQIDIDAIAIEIVSALIGAVSFIVMTGYDGLSLALLGWLFLPLAWLDFRHYWLPDILTALLALCGLTAVFFGLLDLSLSNSLIGGASGFLTLWLVSTAYKSLRGREGLGGGDAKLFGAIGLWFGWQLLPFILMFAAMFGLILALVAIIGGREVTGTSRFPFGTLLAISAWLVMAVTGGQPVF